MRRHFEIIYTKYQEQNNKLSFIAIDNKFNSRRVIAFSMSYDDINFPSTVRTKGSNY